MVAETYNLEFFNVRYSVGIVSSSRLLVTSLGANTRAIQRLSFLAISTAPQQSASQTTIPPVRDR